VVPGLAKINDSALVSPAIAITRVAAKLNFRKLHDLESAFDGGVLEIKIEGGAFQDILAAGESFVSGGYNATIDNSRFSNPTGEPSGLTAKAFSA
jgi:hypothetical protein